MMTETAREEDENAELLTVMREELDVETLVLLYKLEFLNMPADRRDRVMIDTLLQVMTERGIRVPDGKAESGGMGI